ncbi:endonuclease/exonuclease/phosphatase family protein [Desulforamulus aquiferis]|uniref:Endonuclease/exonuclease/phosphatase family protein n=1 Tax=Desulforamulus aquiferis TaxID=1397668 RepID=A0AAW7Z6W2_9FIRM|nr:endonuclease/exonuclease/phosphatase family protein [Desulforamulus aquiferis]MDO7785783.1 endonuclease/exonuclease/phosphatase family protein [Desulforamulus aquiferis]RYD06704.1 hypothetical protein N752_03250 [Desulforamulus aquiferis]
METVRVASYNIHHAQGTDNRINLNRVAAVLACSGAQLMGLQEVDKYLPRSCFRHQARRLGKLLQRQWVYGSTLKWSPAKYGNAVLSRWPIVKWENHLLTSTGEQRGLIEAIINIRGVPPIAFYCTHLGLSKMERKKQAQEVLDIIFKKRYPSILVGDFNSDRNSPEYELITSFLQDATGIARALKTFPAQKPEEQLDFIFVSHEWEVMSAFTVESQASDHLAVICDIRLIK